MKKTAYILLLGLITTCVSFGQQQFVFTNYLLNEYYYNPALAGSKDVHYANLITRQQWAGFEDAPFTVMGNFYGSIRNEKKHGYGISLMSDRTGITQNTMVYLNYAYHVNLGSSLRMGLGVKPGFMQYRIKLYDAQLADQGDDILTGNVFTANALDLNSGLHLYSDRFFFIASMRHMVGKSIQFTTYNSSLAKHYSGIIGYRFGKDDEKSKLDFIPSVMFQYVDPAPPQTSIMMKFVYDDKFWAGLTGRTNDALGLVLGMQVNKRINIGYGFDYSLGDVRNYQSGTHEIMISIVTTPDRPTLDEEDDDLNNSIFEQNQQRIDDDE